MELEFKKPKNPWKVLALLLLIAIIVQNIYFFTLFKIGENIVANRNTCEGNCVLSGADTHQFNIETQECTCFNDNQIISVEVLN